MIAEEDIVRRLDWHPSAYRRIYRGDLSAVIEDGRVWGDPIEWLVSQWVASSGGTERVVTIGGGEAESVEDAMAAADAAAEAHR